MTWEGFLAVVLALVATALTRLVDTYLPGPPTSSQPGTGPHPASDVVAPPASPPPTLPRSDTLDYVEGDGPDEGLGGDRPGP